MTTIDTARLRALAEKATPGPWELIGGNEYVTGVGVLVAPDDGGVTPANAAYIAAADPQTVLALLDEVDAARAERDERFFQAQREMGASEEFIKNLRGLMAGIEATGTPYQPLAKSGDGDA